MSLRYVLGLDSSTQSLSAVVVDRHTSQVVRSFSVTYRTDPRLQAYGLDPELVLLPPRNPGEADQPPLLFLASLEALFTDLRTAGIALDQIDLINVSAQQHGHVYLSAEFDEVLDLLRSASDIERPLDQLLARAFSYNRAPIWKTSDTEAQARDLRKAAGGAEAMIRRTGSDSPLRFTGAVARKVFQNQQGVWEKTTRVHLLSSFLPAVLTACADVPFDWGNASGTSLMDYSHRTWDSELMAAASEGLTGGVGAFQKKWPPLAHPLNVAGTIAPWFVKKYGFSAEARVLIGSGDNPQTKVLVDGDLLSLGTSFVMMVNMDQAQVDLRGWGNAMYDGVGRPFLFGCRTNGALAWDQLRQRLSPSLNDFSATEAALNAWAPGSVMALFQPDNESFPPSPATGLVTPPGLTPEQIWAGCVDSALGLVYRGSRPWLEGRTSPLAVTGGPSASPAIQKRIAAFWNRPVVTIGTTGAALGAAAAALALDGESATLLPPSVPVFPDPKAVEALHRPGGYLDQLETYLAQAKN